MPLALAVFCLVSLQAAPMRVDTGVAMKQIVKQVDPVFPPEVVAANPGAPFAAEVIVRANGTVESVNILVGPDALRAAAIAALKQWTFTPFTNAGRPVRAITLIDIKLADPAREASQRYFEAFFACERSAGMQAPDAEAVCRRALSLADALPAANVLERAHSFEAVGMLDFRQNKWAESLAEFERALDWRKRVSDDSDADVASLYHILAELHVRLKNLPVADQLFGKSVETFERAIEKLPRLRDNYAERLAVVLRSYAALKRSMGQSSEGQALEAKATTLTLPVRGVPMPAAKRIGSVLCLGPGGSLLNDDDVRQLLTHVPAGKKAWLLSGTRDTVPTPKLYVSVYLEPDVTTPKYRSGQIVTVEAALTADTPPTAPKAWKAVPVAVRYVQVLLASRDPGDIRGNADRNRPIAVFKSTSGELNDTEVVEIVTAIRDAADKAAASGDPADPRRLYAVPQAWPIEDMVRWGNGDVDVKLSENVTLDGHGQVVKVKKVGALWTVIDIRPW